jgi:pimeloyl-ACP methyl ester carboxylesterase
MTFSFTWRYLWPALADTFRMYMLDLPGHGASAQPRRAYSLDEFARYLEKFFCIVGIDQASVIGTAMGGSIAAWFAYRYPHRVKRLVVLAAGAVGESTANLWLYRLASLPCVGRLVTGMLPRADFARRWRAAYSQKEAATEEVIDEYYGPVRRAGHVQARLGLKVRANYGSAFVVAMRSITAPTLLIFGEDDPVIPLEAAYRFRDCIPNAALITLPHCGDFPQEEQPALVAGALRDFLARPSETAWRA